MKVGAFTSKPVIVIYKCKNSPTPEAILILLKLRNTTGPNDRLGLKESMQNMYEKISTNVGQIHNKTKDFRHFLCNLFVFPPISLNLRK